MWRALEERERRGDRTQCDAAPGGVIFRAWSAATTPFESQTDAGAWPSASQMAALISLADADEGLGERARR